MNKFSDENNFNNKEANKCVGIHGAIFDVDGTLLDSMVIWEEAAVRYLNSLGLEPEENLSEKIMTMSMEEVAIIIGMSFDASDLITCSTPGFSCTSSS